MATVLNKVDAVIVGFGWAGAIMAKELTEAGLHVVALERGPMQDTYPEGSYPQVIDELTYSVRKKLFVDVSKETVTVRHNVNDVALPNRQLGAFLPGKGVGGAGLHWSGVHFRVDPVELRLRSHYEERYGRKFIPEGMTIQDFGVSYEELEPYFDFAEKVFGTSGQAWTVNGQVSVKGRVVTPMRRTAPTPSRCPRRRTWCRPGCSKKLPPAWATNPTTCHRQTPPGLTPTYGAQMGPCNFCGFCSGYVCYMYSKASPNVNILPALRQVPNFELRPNAHVLRVNLDDSKRKATGVTYIDAQGREVEQPAELVILAAFQFNNVRLMLLSGIGKPYDPVKNEGVVGRNFAYQNMGTVKAFFDKNTYTNNFIGAGGNGIAIDDFNADNFDHGPHGFVGGSPMWVNQAGSRPIAGTSNPPGTPAWGSAWKKATADYYTHQVSMDAHGAHQSYRANYLDLDPTYRDAYGQPLLRMTFDWQENDIKMNQFMVDKLSKIAQAMNPKAIAVLGKQVKDHFNTASYQTTHLNGGAIMGTDPKTSALNRYLQSWDVHNVFVPGASAFPQGLGYNPTGLVAALTYWSARAIREQYLKNPGPLVQA